MRWGGTSRALVLLCEPPPGCQSPVPEVLPPPASEPRPQWIAILEVFLPTSHSLSTHFPLTSHSLLRAIIIRIPEPEPISVSDSGPACTFELEDQRVPLTTIKTSDGTNVVFNADGHSQVLSFSSKKNPELVRRIQLGRELAENPRSKRAGSTVGPPDGKFLTSFDDGKGILSSSSFTFNIHTSTLPLFRKYV